MANPEPAGTINVPYLITSRKFPFDQVELPKTLTKMYPEIANAVNSRTIGIFETAQVVTGEKWFNNFSATNSNQFFRKRETYRKVFPWTGPIAPGGTLEIPHGLTGVTNFTRIYGTTITDFPDNRPIPYADPAGNQNIGITVDETDINITNGNGTGANNLLSGIIVLEYLLN